MRINSEEGTGTCVELFLPSADKSEQRTESESIDPLKAMANGETVLVLDSDSTVCEAIAMQLKELGYTALQADTPVTAMEMLETYLETKVVLLDILPSDKINGVSLAQELRANRSDLEVLFTSAHGRSTFKQNGIPGDVENVLFKPYRKSDLAKKLRELLDDQATL